MKNNIDYSQLIDQLEKEKKILESSYLGIERYGLDKKQSGHTEEELEIIREFNNFLVREKICELKFRPDKDGPGLYEAIKGHINRRIEVIDGILRKYAQIDRNQSYINKPNSSKREKRKYRKEIRMAKAWLVKEKIISVVRMILKPFELIFGCTVGLSFVECILFALALIPMGVIAVNQLPAFLFGLMVLNCIVSTVVSAFETVYRLCLLMKGKGAYSTDLNLFKFKKLCGKRMKTKDNLYGGITTVKSNTTNEVDCAASVQNNYVENPDYQHINIDKVLSNLSPEELKELKRRLLDVLQGSTAYDSAACDANGRARCKRAGRCS